MFTQKYSKDKCVEAYLQTQSQNKAAEIIGCSRETIARACRESGIVLNGRRNNGDHKGNGGGGSPRKITDEELIVESKSMTRCEIAKKHKMNICNVDRKLKRLGITCVSGAGLGSGHSHYIERCSACDAEYDRAIDLPYVIAKHKGICQICGKPIDESSRSGKGIGKLYPTIDHIIPLSRGGTHTDNNVRLAHMICNALKGDAI